MPCGWHFTPSFLGDSFSLSPETNSLHSPQRAQPSCCHISLRRWQNLSPNADVWGQMCAPHWVILSLSPFHLLSIRFSFLLLSFSFLRSSVLSVLLRLTQSQCHPLLRLWDLRRQCPFLLPGRNECSPDIPWLPPPFLPHPDSFWAMDSDRVTGASPLAEAGVSPSSLSSPAVMTLGTKGQECGADKIETRSPCHLYFTWERIELSLC